MEHAFWESRWSEGKLGFHRNDVNPALMAHAPQLDPFPGTVFVPLCGKSVDMRWLAEQGANVLGVELVDLAVKAFFEEQGLESEVVHEGDGGLIRHRCTTLPITIYQGDLFAVDAAHLSEVTWVYDRASLVALPAEMRARYGAHLDQRLPAHAQMLTLVFEYDQGEMDGPPFSVTEDEVARVFPGWRFETRQVEALPVPEHLARGGLSGWSQRVLLGVRRGTPPISPTACLGG